MRSAACIAIQDLEASIMQNMLKEMCGTVLHVFNWKRAQNSHMRAYITSSRMRKRIMLIPYPGVDTKKVQDQKKFREKWVLQQQSWGLDPGQNVLHSHKEAPVIKDIMTCFADPESVAQAQHLHYGAPASSGQGPALPAHREDSVPA